MRRAPRRPSLLSRAYAWLSRLYPASFRDEYQRELDAAFRHQIDEAGPRRAPGCRRRAGRRAADRAGRSPRSAAPGHPVCRRTLTARSQRSFAVAAILTLALGIGAATAIFSIVYAVMLAPLPYRDAATAGADLRDQSVAQHQRRFRPRCRISSRGEQQVTRMSLAAIKDAPANLSDGGRGDPRQRTQGNGELLRGDRPAARQGPRIHRGRGPAGRTEGRHRQRGTLAAPLRRTPRHPLARPFSSTASRIPWSASRRRTPASRADVDLWVPMAADLAAEGRGDKRLAVVGRLAAGATVGGRAGGTAAVAGALAREFPADNGGWNARLEPIFDWIVGEDLPLRMRLLVIAVGLLLLVACANVANLQLARAAGRTGELGVRLALGASRARLLRQTLTERLVLASAGRPRGLGLAWALVRGGRGVLAESIPRLAELSINVPVLSAAVVATLAVALVSGVLPALLAGRADIRDALQHAGRPAATVARAPIRHALVGVQLALTTALVVGAALLLQSTWNMEGQALGFRAPESLLTANISRPQGPNFKLDRDVAFYDAVLREAAALPGVVSVALSSGVPLAYGNTGMSIGTKAPAKGEPVTGVQASWRIVSPSYFRTLDVPVLRGSIFDPRRRPRRHAGNRDQQDAGGEAVAQRRGPDRPLRLSRRRPVTSRLAASSATCGSPASSASRCRRCTSRRG